MTAKFVWNELITPDQDISGEFFCRLFNREQQAIDIGTQGMYTIFKENGNDIAGMMNPATDFSKSRPSFWSAYIEVDDVDTYVNKVEGLGGTIIAPPENVQNVGRICMISDPNGAPVCLITSANMQTE